MARPLPDNGQIRGVFRATDGRPRGATALVLSRL